MLSQVRRAKIDLRNPRSGQRRRGGVEETKEGKVRVEGWFGLLIEWISLVFQN